MTSQSEGKSTAAMPPIKRRYLPSLGAFATFEVDLPTLQNRTGLRFPTLATTVPEAAFGPALLEHVTDIAW